MATAKKKTTGSRRKSTASSGRSSAKKTTAKVNSAEKTTSGKSAATTASPRRREIGALVCLLLAFFACFGYFEVHGWFIDLFVGLLKGLFGYGFWFAPPALLVAAYVLGFHRGRPVRLRLCCVLLLPLVLGCLLHLFLFEEELAWEMAMLGRLWTAGSAMQSGGAVGGIIALLFAKAFHVIGATAIFVVMALIMLLTAFNRTIVQIVEAIRNRPRREYVPEEEQPEPESVQPPVRESPEINVEKRKRRTQTIDIPMDDEQPAELVETKPKKKKFFERESRVPAPDQVLLGVEQNNDAGAAKPVHEPAVSPDPFIDEIDNTPTPAAAPLPPKVKPEEAAQAAAEITAEIEESSGQPAVVYEYPPVSLLVEGEGGIGADALGELKINQNRLAETIHSFGIEAQINNVTRGPSVTRYEVELEQGVRLNKLTNLADDIALALGASGVRIAPIPDKISMVGIEVPNKLVSPVYIHDVIASDAFKGNESKVTFALGKDIGGNCIVGNIAKLPHLLIAGTTGSGKSVCTNSLIISLLYKASPEDVRMIMVDPKMVELGIYNGIPHLLIPVVTDPKKAAGALQWAVTEMMKRYRAFSEVGVRDLQAFNAHAVRTGEVEKLPQIVVVIDELADLMLVAAKEVEESICRVAQMGRAAGMHLVIATQRPSADVITGLMKANIPSRIAFAVASALESRIILDTMGAEKLVGRGDMLYFPLGAGKPTRVQGCLISDKEVADVVEFVKKSGTAKYDDSVIYEIEQHAAEKDKGSKSSGASAPETTSSDYDELLPSAIEVVLEQGQASVSMLQRRLKLGYSRAARLVDQMEEKGIVGPFEGSKARQILITKEQWQEMQFKQDMQETLASDPVPEEFPYEGDAFEQDRDRPPF